MGPEVIGTLIPIFVTLGAFAMVFGLRYLRNKENMAMIDKGMDPKLNEKSPSPFRSLKWGLLFVGVGLGLFIAYLLEQFALPKDADPEAIYFGLICIGGGLGLIGSYKIEKREVFDKNN
ncbi:MAG: hypothetical protein RLZZ316_2309 [Bacteroidota bacterium]|jgi:hypothetical protein